MNLDELSLSPLFFIGSDNKYTLTYFLNIFLRLRDNVAVLLSLLFFSRIIVYVLMERQYIYFLWILSFWQHVYNFLYQLPNLSGVREYFTVYEPGFSEYPVNFSLRNTTLSSIFYFSFFSKLSFLLKLLYWSEQNAGWTIYTRSSFSLALLQILWSFQKTKKKSTVEFVFCFRWRVCLLCR